MSQFRILNDALELNRLVRPVVVEVAKHDRKLADQLRRAAQSVVANVAEGRNRRGGHQRERFSTAYGEANETKVHLRMTSVWQYVTEERTAKPYDLADKIAASLWRCMHR